MISSATSPSGAVRGGKSVATIHIDGTTYEVRAGDNLLHSALSLGLDLPYFCWHPAMNSVGACRQCAVIQYKDENDSQGRLVMACMTEITDGGRFSIKAQEAVDFRASVIEWLMVNHPHDCPVCDEGGECHLQDMTVMTGHDYRRTRFPKRTYTNQYLGPFINHEMNRCIQCYRCVRFYNDLADGADFGVFRAHDEVYFGRSQEGVLENEFSGNLVEVCPTGVFTDKSLRRHYTRKWDLQTAPSICVNCSIGCNTIPGERYGELRRIRNRYNLNVNGYFLCDRGRYGYEFVNSPGRIRQVILRKPEGDQALAGEALRTSFKNILGEGARMAGLGSPRATLEANFALRTLVGSDRFFGGVSSQTSQLVEAVIDVLQKGPAPSASLHEVSQSDTAFVLGEDLTNYAPMAAFALRQAVRVRPTQEALKIGIPNWNELAIREVVQDTKGPLYIATYAATRLDDIAARTLHAGPDEIARLGFAVAHALDPQAPAVAELTDDLQALAEEIASALSQAENPLVVSGTSSGSLEIIHAAAQVAWALCKQGKPARIFYTLPENNSFGLGLLTSTNIEQARQLIQNDQVDTLIVLENDLYQQAEKSLVDELMNSAVQVVALDFLENDTNARAVLSLPAATFAEGDGTLVNNEGRAQRAYQVFVPQGEICESWRWLAEMATVVGREEAENWSSLDDVINSMVRELPQLAPVAEIAPPESFRIDGAKIPRQPHRYSGRTSMHANIAVSEPKPPDDPDSPLAYSMEGFKGIPPAALISRYWAPGWNSVQALNKFQSEVAGPLIGGDPGRRLIVADENASPAYFEPASLKTPAQPGSFQLVPLYHIFGSESLSMHSPGVTERAPQAYLALNPADAQTLELNSAENAQLTLQGRVISLPVRLETSLPAGLIGIPVGLPGSPRVNLPMKNASLHRPQPEEKDRP
jgi:NADH-quinone oxidoreductase subunit G